MTRFSGPLRAPTNEEIRQEAIAAVPLCVFDRKGSKSEGWRLVFEEYLRLQFQYFPLFCQEAFEVNRIALKELEMVGYKTPTRMIAGMMCQGSTGWSKDKNFKHKWIIPNQLRTFMQHIHQNFWTDENQKTRDKFMKGIMKRVDPYTLLNEVYKHYGKNVIKSVTKEDREALGISA